MRRNTKFKIKNSKSGQSPIPTPRPPMVAFLWDESFLWGLMAYKALKGLGLPFDLIKAEDIKTGALNNYKMLFVPGGWASNKVKALGSDGISAIQEFVSGGGSYLGFCGGAGLATTGRDGIGLLNIRRRPTKERVPSFSGRIELKISEHPMWNGIPSSRRGNPPWLPRAGTETCPYNSVFHAWWPSQFIVEDENIKILSTYGDAMPDAFSSDICVGDVSPESKWDELEGAYKINLNPARLKDEPAVIEGTYGKGKVILSLVHFDTPDDENGQKVLVNLWEYLLKSEVRSQKSEVSTHKPHAPEDETVFELEKVAADIISLGQRNFLWFWRNSMLLQWRRGVRGLEYNTLYVMMKEIQEVFSCQPSAVSKDMDVYPDRINKLLLPFVDKAGRLLILERHAMQKGHITYERCDDPEIQKLRGELFSESKSHGGQFKELLDEIDRFLFLLLT